MVSDEWWVYHLTKNGWVAGNYKHDFKKEVEIIAPIGTLLSRRYFEKLGHPRASMDTGFDNLSGVSSKEVQQLLIKYPHPNGFPKEP